MVFAEMNFNPSFYDSRRSFYGSKLCIRLDILHQFAQRVSIEQNRTEPLTIYDILTRAKELNQCVTHLRGVPSVSSIAPDVYNGIHGVQFVLVLPDLILNSHRVYIISAKPDAIVPLLRVIQLHHSRRQVLRCRVDFALQGWSLCGRLYGSLFSRRPFPCRGKGCMI